MEILKNTRHELFCVGLAKGRSEKDAYIEAGFKCKVSAVYAAACRLRKKPDIAKRIEELKNAACRRNAISIDRTLEEIANIAYSNPKDFLDEIGEPIPLKDLPREVAAALGMKPADKLVALEKICRRLGIAKEQLEHHGNVVFVTPEDWLKREPEDK